MSHSKSSTGTVPSTLRGSRPLAQGEKPNLTGTRSIKSARSSKPGTRPGTRPSTSNKPLTARSQSNQASRPPTTATKPSTRPGTRPGSSSNQASKPLTARAISKQASRPGTTRKSRPDTQARAHTPSSNIPPIRPVCENCGDTFEHEDTIRKHRPDCAKLHQGLQEPHALVCHYCGLSYSFEALQLHQQTCKDKNSSQAFDSLVPPKIVPTRDSVPKQIREFNAQAMRAYDAAQAYHDLSPSRKQKARKKPSQTSLSIDIKEASGKVETPRTGRLSRRRTLAKYEQQRRKEREAREADPRWQDLKARRIAEDKAKEARREARRRAMEEDSANLVRKRELEQELKLQQEYIAKQNEFIQKRRDQQLREMNERKRQKEEEHQAKKESEAQAKRAKLEKAKRLKEESLARRAAQRVRTEKWLLEKRQAIKLKSMKVSVADQAAERQRLEEAVLQAKQRQIELELDVQRKEEQRRAQEDKRKAWRDSLDDARIAKERELKRERDEDEAYMQELERIDKVRRNALLKEQLLLKQRKEAARLEKVKITSQCQELKLEEAKRLREQSRRRREDLRARKELEARERAQAIRMYALQQIAPVRDTLDATEEMLNERNILSPRQFQAQLAQQRTLEKQKEAFNTPQQLTAPPV